MIKQVFKRQELPWDELQKLGLAKDGRLLLDEDDITSLLSGRRTDMLRLENLRRDGLHIPMLDSKLSLVRNELGEVELRAHPIYKEPVVPSYLTDTEAEMLEKGDAVNLEKTIDDGKGGKIDVIIEFDRDTNEFITVDTDGILIPEGINGKPLTAEQKERYRKGKEVKTDDGTTLQYSATEKQGIRSDRLALVASILIDGGITYVLYKGLNALFNKPQEKEPGKNYAKALDEFNKQQAKRFSDRHQPEAEATEEQSETISR